MHEGVLSLVPPHEPGALDRGERGVGALADHRVEERVGHVTADQRRDGEEVTLDVAQCVDAAIDRTPDPQRLGRVGERHRLDHEERVAAGEPAKVLGLGG